jgi:hypothetical protein
MRRVGLRAALEPRRTVRVHQRQGTGVPGSRSASNLGRHEEEGADCEGCVIIPNSRPVPWNVHTSDSGSRGGVRNGAVETKRDVPFDFGRKRCCVLVRLPIEVRVKCQHVRAWRKRRRTSESKTQLVYFAPERRMLLTAKAGWPDFLAIRRSCSSITARAGASPSRPPRISRGTCGWIAACRPCRTRRTDRIRRALPASLP